MTLAQHDFASTTTGRAAIGRLFESYDFFTVPCELIHLLTQQVDRAATWLRPTLLASSLRFGPIALGYRSEVHLASRIMET